MEQNKVIDHIYKKLIKSNYSHDEIKHFLAERDNFKKFENWLYYLFLNSQKTYEDDKFKMASVLGDYLATLIERHEIKPLTVDSLVEGDILSNHEVYILGAKGYDGNNNFCFDVDENLYICIDSIKSFKYQNIFNIKFNQYLQGFSKSKLNLKIINKQVKKILIFTKAGNQNIFIGFYDLLSLNHFYDGSSQLYGFSVIKHNANLEMSYQYKNLLQRQAEESLALLKTELTEIVNESSHHLYKFLDIINVNKNHMTILLEVLNHAIKHNCQSIVFKIKNKFYEMLSLNYTAFSLVPNVSKISQYHLTILANCFDILWGKGINADYLNNIFMVLNTASMQVDEAGDVYVRFVKSYYHRYFEVDINKKIFNTSKENTVIYLFKPVDNQYQFMGLYKVSRVIIGKDNLKESCPVFVLKPINDIDLFRHAQYLLKNKSSTNYRNAFKSLIDNPHIDQSWFHKKTQAQRELIEVTDEKQSLINSHVMKYNWLLKKILKTYNTSLFDKYFQSHFEYDNRMLNYMLAIATKDFGLVIDKELMHPATIAYEMTKNSYASKELFDISYVDHYQTKRTKYAICKAMLKK